MAASRPSAGNDMAASLSDTRCMSRPPPAEALATFWTTEADFSLILDMREPTPCAPEPPFSAAMKDDEEEGAAAADVADADDLDGDDCVPGAVSNSGELSFLAISKSGGSNGSMPLLKDTDVRCSRIYKEKTS